MKGTQATIQLGTIPLDVIMKPDGSYGVYIRQMERTLDVKAYDKMGKKLLKPILDKHSNVFEKVSGLPGIKSSVLVIPIEVFKEVVAVYAQHGNEKAQLIMSACFLEALERRADAAFGVKVDEEERNARLALRMTIKKDFRTQLTDHLKEQGATEPHHYINAVVKLNKAVGTHGLKRDDYSPEQLSKMEQAQKFIGRRMEKGVGFYEALTDYQEMLG